LSNHQLVDRFEDLEREIHLLGTLRGINIANNDVLSGKNIVLLFKDEGELEIFAHTSSAKAVEHYFQLEKTIAGGSQDVVLVSAESGADIRVAFRNYFSDTSDFVRYVDDGCTELYL